MSLKGAKRFLVRPRASAQIAAVIRYYAVTMRAPNAARGFVDELQKAYELIRRNPDAGSPRLETELGMPGLRSWGLPKYPYLIIYFRHPNLVDVVDVPHTRTNYVAALIDHL
ncbi:hypothetical protein APR50_07295 [Variovorax paradoxus]|nr:hypothetical protein APR49_41530 [Variovorax paradoxus]KPV10223.1 hypothetical protein APR50_07295 [Variovorax paradoxus]KPV19649.1 hypothetical protein APR48_39630 [Variovorax paradoxus]KPV20958.1 hypothetical protein APR47_39335 [Variovorax paradoxus]